MQFSGKSSSVRLFAAVLAVACSFPLTAQTTPTSSIKHANVAIPSVHIKNFGQINENYYRGAQPEGQDYSDLKALGVKTVINLINDEKSDEVATVQGMGMTYVHIPMTTGTPPTQEQIKQFLSLVEDPAHQPVFVHCVGGKHRTGVMTAIYRMTEDGWSSDQAFKEMKQYKFGADFLHPEFKSFVYHFQPDHTRTATKVAITTPSAAPMAAEIRAQSAQTARNHLERSACGTVFCRIVPPGFFRLAANFANKHESRNRIRCTRADRG